MNSKEKSLLVRINKLSDQSRQSLEDYLDFLIDRQPVTDQNKQTEPLDIPRPQSESVIQAMRRLTKTYSMLDTKDLFSEASSLMSQNVLQGRQAVEVIDDLQALFHSRYLNNKTAKPEQENSE